MRTAPQIRMSPVATNNDPKTALKLLKREIDSKLNPWMRDLGFAIKRHDKGLQSTGGAIPIPTPGGPFFLLPGRQGGQIGYGALESGGFLKLRSTAHAVKGGIYFGSLDASVYDDVNQRLGLGTTSPLARAHVKVAAGPSNKSRPNGFDHTNVTKPWTNPFSGTINPATGGFYNVWETVYENTWPGTGDGTYCQTNGGTMVVGSGYDIELNLEDVTFTGNSTGWQMQVSLRRVNPSASVISVGVTLFQSTTNVWNYSIPNGDIGTAFADPNAIQPSGTASYTSVIPASAIAGMIVTGGKYQNLKLSVNLTVISTTFNLSGTEFLQWGWGQLQVPGSSTSDVTALILENNSSDGQALLSLKNAGGNEIKMTAPSTVTTHTLTWPGAIVNNGFLKVVTGGQLSWDTTPGAHALLSATHIDTDVHTAVLGDIIAANSTPHWQAVAGNTTATRKFLRQTGNGSISALPAWDTIVAADVPGSALTKVDDTNVTLTLGGSPTVALLAATSLTLGWTGTLSIARGGTGAGTALAAFNALSPLTTRGDLLTRDASNNVRLGIGTADQIVQTDGTDPIWTDPLRLGATAYNTNTPLPATPAANKVRVFADSMGTSGARLNPAYLREEGRGQWLQGMVGWNSGFAILPASGTNPTIWGTSIGATAGTISHPSLSSTNLFTSSRKINGSSASPANSTSTMFENLPRLWRGNAAGLGGFYFVARVSWSLDTEDGSGSFCFVGLSSSTVSIAATKPSALTNIIGIGSEPGNLNKFQITHNDGTAGSVQVDLGTNFTTAHLLQFELFCPVNGSTIYYRVMRLDDKTIAPAVGSFNTRIPANTAFLGFHIYTNNGNVGGAPVIWSLYRMYAECDV